MLTTTGRTNLGDDFNLTLERSDAGALSKEKFRQMKSEMEPFSTGVGTFVGKHMRKLSKAVRIGCMLVFLAIMTAVCVLYSKPGGKPPPRFSPPAESLETVLSGVSGKVVDRDHCDLKTFDLVRCARQKLRKQT